MISTWNQGFNSQSDQKYLQPASDYISTEKLEENNSSISELVES
ncbi:MAG: hypothetical protein RMX68_014070 [Aulosira sp. ZfuVER01]|nr:hypothetical protein [Aulosira sp. DedVER01a]